MNEGQNKQKYENNAKIFIIAVVWIMLLVTIMIIARI